MLLAFVPVLMIAVSLVSAHALLVRSEPENGQTLKQSPGEVIAWFSQELDSSSSQMQVFDAQGRQADNGDGGVDLNDLDHRTMKATLRPDLPASTYTVHWVALSAEDGDPVDGEFTFGVGVASTQSSPQPEAKATPTLWPLIGLTAFILAAAGAAATFVRRRRDSHQEERVVSREGYV